MRLFLFTALAMGLSACAAAPPPVPGPPLSATSAAVSPMVTPLASSRVGGVLMTAAAARAMPAAIGIPVTSALAFVIWLAPAKAEVDPAASGSLPPGRAVTDADLAALGLDRAGAVALAEANLRAGLRPAGTVLEPPPTGAVGVDSGDFGEAGRIVLTDEWSGLAASLGGRLLVAVPAADTVLYAGGGDIAALQARAARVMAEAARPISPVILRWSGEGWRIAASPGGGV